MAKKRVHEIAKERGISSAQLIEAFRGAGIDVKTASSSVDESQAEKVLNGAAGDGKGGSNKQTAATKRRRVVIDAQASRKQPEVMQQAPQKQVRKGGRRRAKAREIKEKLLIDAETEVEEAPGEEDEAQLEPVTVKSGSTVKDVAHAFNVSVPELMKELMKMGEMASITQTLPDEAIVHLGDELGRKVTLEHIADELEQAQSFTDSDEDLQARPPVIVVMGHVDHGKTSLLDAIRQTDVVAQEAGGITQHIGAYQVHHSDKVITFLDTPGHQAFTAMRARGAKITDVAVIVVAADDGVKPQTVEAIDHAKAAAVPMLIAVNKIDKEGASPEKVRSEMAGQGLNPEEWGGDTVFCDVSAKTKQGLDELLDMIVLVTEVEELMANPKAEASGTVIESQLDPGRGPVVTILVQRGTLRVGDALVAGNHWGRVRAMHDYLGQKVDEARPGQPIEILGFDSVPDAGEHTTVVVSEREARQLAEERHSRLRAEILGRGRMAISLEDLFEKAKKGSFDELNLVVKADVAGSLEAIEDEFAKAPQDEIKLNTIHAAVGGVNESDVMLAAASDAVIIAFNVRPLQEAKAAAAREGVEIRSYTVIYKLVDELKSAMEGMLTPEVVERDLGTVEVREIFKASKVGNIAGCYVTDGKVTRGAKIRVVRDGTVVTTSLVSSLRRFKDDVREVESGYECGVTVKDFPDVKPGDVLEVFATEKVERQLAGSKS